VKFEGVFGKAFAGFNVLAMVASGITTIISMSRSASKARSLGDYLAADLYDLGALGGGFMMAGGLVMGACFLQTVGILVSNPFTATVGVVLFFVGGILAAIGSFFGWFFSTNVYHVYARKCFLGKDRHLEPRFQNPAVTWDNPDPPLWSGALKTKNESWPIKQQRKALYNLLGQFGVQARIFNHSGKLKDTRDRVIQGRVEYKITPGLLRHKSKIRVAIEYEGDRGGNVAEFEWLDDQDHAESVGYRKLDLVLPSSGTAARDLFDSRTSDGYAELSHGQTSEIHITAPGLIYNSYVGDLWTTVTITYVDLPNEITARLPLIRRRLDPWLNTYYDCNPDEVVSEIFKYNPSLEVGRTL
jgi:hypothetical protein